MIRNSIYWGIYNRKDRRLNLGFKYKGQVLKKTLSNQIIAEFLNSLKKIQKNDLKIKGYPIENWLSSPHECFTAQIIYNIELTVSIIGGRQIFFRTIEAI